MNDEELMANRLCELAERSYTNNYYTYTDFLGLADISLLKKLARSDDRMKGIKYRLYGGTDDAERVIAAFGDEDAFIAVKSDDLITIQLLINAIMKNDFKSWKELGSIPETEPIKSLFVRLGYSKEDIANMLKEF